MALRKGIVVGVHPEDHAVDLVMIDNYQRLVGVKVQSPTASSRSGAIDLPDVGDRADKWDISDVQGHEVQALVDWVGSVPVVTGFIFPRKGQMTHNDAKLKYNRHTSDVQTYTDGTGNMGLLHPSGAHITIGTAPEPKDFTGANFDKSLKVDRNTDKKVFLRVALAGNVAVLTMTPEGACTLHLDKTLDIDCTTATIKASDSIVLQTPKTHITGDVQIDGAVNTGSSITSKGDQVAGTVSQQGHVHTGVQGGKDKSGAPVQ
ncbi:hypothetical protein NAD41_000878 [Salmonella enterica]|nr:hypothetical protein [Salmonella enterica]EKK6596262.1 hypothetical protein [Salmonella enterica]